MVDRFTVGNVEIGAVLDMIPPPRHPGDFFPDVPQDAWKPYANDVLVEGQIQLYYGHFFVRSQGKTIMVDTGMGPGPHPSRGNLTGDLLNQLSKQGVKPEDVDTWCIRISTQTTSVGTSTLRETSLARTSPTPATSFPKPIGNTS